MLTLGKKALEKTGKAVVSLLDEIIAIFANIRNSAKNIKPFLDEILEWLRKFFDDAKKSKSIDELADLTKNELDWMASRSLGNLGGNIIKASQIRKLRGILKQKGITLIVEGDIKSIVKGYKQMGNFKSFDELVSFMKLSNPPKVGLFHAHTRQMILSKECTEIVAFHEMCHLKHFEEVGEIAYKGYDVLEKEMYVWKQILANRSRWTEKELKESLRYINDIRTDPVHGYNLEPIIIK